MKKSLKGFNKRTFATLAISVAFIGLIVSGIANHTHQFDSMRTVRHSWMAAHNAFACVFVGFVLFHVLLNRRLFFNHLKSAIAGAPSARREAAAAGIVIFLALLLSVGHTFHLR